ncbi:MAG: cytochrome c oxidase subunit II [Myxacorys chilensis ATA2-1-KO14]|nr:cytochrome c oxidase subunit II [Myxacorys chilensis ATA2-1-KO14]
MNIPSQITTLLAGILLTLISFWYGQNHNLLPVEASKNAASVDSLFNAMLTIGTGIFLLVAGILIYSAIKFRRDPDDTSDGPPVHGNIPLEILWTAIPAIIVLGISVYSFDVYMDENGMNPMDHMAHGKAQHQVAAQPGNAVAQLTGSPAFAATLVSQADPNQQQAESILKDPATNAVREDIPQRKDAPTLGTVSPRVGSSPEKTEKPAEVVISATGMQYAWLFTYPGTEVVAGELHVPLGRDVLINISANDVLHAFWVPEFRLKQDAVPGRQTEIRFTPTREGQYPLICAELCGAYHGAMKTIVVVEPQEAYDSWLQSQEVASAEVLDRAIAANPATMTDEEYLAPYAQDIGITAAALEQLHSHEGHS